MSFYFCCCNPGCWSFSDTFCCLAPQFHCDPYPNLGVYWEPLPTSSPTGNWWVDGDACLLIEDGTPGAIIRNTPCVPAGPLNASPADCAPINPGDPDDCHCLETASGYTGECTPYMRATVLVLGLVPGAGHSWSILIRMKDENNYVEGRLVWDASSNVYFQVWQKVAGVETMLVSCGPTNIAYTGGHSATITLCVNDEKIYGGTNGLAHFENLPDVSPPTIDCGHHGGLKHTSTVQTYFTNYAVTQLHSDHVDCPDCGPCLCQDDPEVRYPKHMLLTFMDLTGDWPGLDGLTMVMSNNVECLLPTIGWGGAITATDNCLSPRTCGGQTHRFDATLLCNPLAPAGPPLLTLNTNTKFIDTRCGGIHWNAVPTTSVAESSCDPLMLVYYYTLAAPDCGVYSGSGSICCDGALPPKCCTCNSWVGGPPPTNVCPVSLKIIITEV